MKVLYPLFILIMLSLIPAFSFAHAGHGAFDASAPMHYLSGLHAGHALAAVVLFWIALKLLNGAKKQLNS